MQSRRGYRDHERLSVARSDVSTRQGRETPVFNTGQQQPACDIFDLDYNTDSKQFHPFKDLGSPILTNSPDLELLLQMGDYMPSPENTGSITSVRREYYPSPLQTSLQLAESTDLIDVYYILFHPAHPFVAPKKLWRSVPSLLPDHLRAVMRFAAAHYIPNTNIRPLQLEALSILSEGLPDDAFKVQGLLLLAIVSFARNDQEQGGHAMQQAVELALRIGMNKHTFSLSQGQNNPILQDSFRRTWWTLYIVNGLVTAIGSGQPFMLHSLPCDVHLPGEDADYNNLQPASLTSSRTLYDLINAPLSSDAYPYSSFAYAILAVHIMGNVFNLQPDTFGYTDPQIETIDASISAFLLSLPPSKRYPITTDTTIPVTDQTLLLAHMFIHWASILIHRPRSSLVYVRSHYHTTCTPKGDQTLPALEYSSHTAKTLHSANSIINLLTMPRSLLCASPMLTCGITVSATVHLPTYATAVFTRSNSLSEEKNQSEKDVEFFHEKLKVGMAALGRMGEIWERANVAKAQVGSFAREVISAPPSPPPTSVTTTAMSRGTTTMKTGGNEQVAEQGKGNGNALATSSRSNGVGCVPQGNTTGASEETAAITSSSLPSNPNMDMGEQNLNQAPVIPGGEIRNRDRDDLEYGGGVDGRFWWNVDPWMQQVESDFAPGS